jgi:acetylornithine/succinyldiaminopimelate/putrescine aminotransferase
MTKNEAIELLQNSKSVDHWNHNREQIKIRLDRDVNQRKFFAEVEGHGLIVKVLGKDR